MKTILTAAAAAAALSFSVAWADEPAPVTQVMKMGDAAMTCSQLIEEAGAMEAVLGGAPDGLDGEALAGAGTALAQHAAIMGGAGRAAGAIGQVGGLLGKSSKKKKEQEALQRAMAEKRWIYVVGLYQGRDCDRAPIEASAAE